jgi:hypothetical protein
VNGFSLSARATQDGGNVAELGPVAITDAAHLIEVAWRRASGASGHDGVLVFQVDGSDAVSLTSLDNSLGGGIDAVTLGLTVIDGPLPGSVPRSVFLDSLASWRLQ